jgi:uracil DNA glycosylase
VLLQSAGKKHNLSRFHWSIGLLVLMVGMACSCRAMNSTQFDKVKVVILGQGASSCAGCLPSDNNALQRAQTHSLGRMCWRSHDPMPMLRASMRLAADPYHNTGQAMGLSFSVPQGIPVPSSLQNIYRELNTDLGCVRPKHGCLLKVYCAGALVESARKGGGSCRLRTIGTDLHGELSIVLPVQWAEQGVLLLNASLTVRAHNANSHKKKVGTGVCHELLVAAVRPASVRMLIHPLMDMHSLMLGPRRRGGRPSRTRPSRPFRGTAQAWCSCCGVHPRRARCTRIWESSIRGFTGRTCTCIT